MAATALDLGVRIKKQRYDPEETGIVRVFSNRIAHVVFQLDGKFIDTDSTIWEPEIYCTEHKMKIGLMLVIEGGE